MRFGMHLRELWRLRRSLIISLALATLAAVWSVWRIGILPPKLEKRSLEIATASTQVMVDASKSAVYDFDPKEVAVGALTARANLMGNVMASSPVREYIARRAGVPAARIKATPPATPDNPRVTEEPGEKKKASDILRSTDQYRFKVAADPSVPLLHVYAQAPTAKASATLANAAVDGLRDYLETLASAQSIPAGRQLRVIQLGRAHGEVINPTVNVQLALVSFVLMFGVSSLALVFFSRVRAGWIVARRDEQLVAKSA